MSVETKREETSAPMGVIGCLSAGFEMLGRNVLLVALPALLDLFLWLGPRLSVAPLLQRIVAVLKAQPSVDSEVARQAAQATRLLEQFGERFNLLSLLSGIPLLHVPSLLARHAPGKVTPLGASHVLRLSSVLALIPWWVGLILVGLVLGFLYLNDLAHRVRALRSSTEREQASNNVEKQQPAGRRPQPVEGACPELVEGACPELVEGACPELVEGMKSGIVRFLQVFLFGVGLLMVGAMLLLLWLLLVAVTTAIAQPLGILAWMLGAGLVSYVALHLIFVIPGVLVGGRGLLRAIGESIVLSRIHLSSVVGLVVLAVLIYEGLGYAWSLPSGDSWTLLIGILGNAAVATGLTAATFVFYQERLAVS